MIPKSAVYSVWSSRIPRQHFQGFQNAVSFYFQFGSAELQDPTLAKNCQVVIQLKVSFGPFNFIYIDQGKMQIWIILKKIIVRMSKNALKNKVTENIQFLIGVGEFMLRLSLPKTTTVGGLIAIVRGYQVLHLDYGPQGMPFIGLASTRIHPLLDYWLTQQHLDFSRFRKKLELKCLYGHERRSDKLYPGQFQFLVCLGKGAYGAVYLVRSKVTGALMALKRVSKQTIGNYQTLMTQFRQRKNLIQIGNNNHTVNMHACFESKSHFNFLMDYYPGGEMFLHLSSQQKQRLSHRHIKQYFCQIILAMEYIHKKKLLYRDLKPENIFVDVNGHLRIGDFGMSKNDFEEDDFAASWCGSEEYMAPEILQKHNYNFSSDFYSIGAILYQLLTGIPPYYKQCQQLKQYQDHEHFRVELIKSMAIDFGKATQNVHLQKLLANLLHPDPDQRISNFQEIKNSPWLNGVDWKVIEQKMDILPFAPDPTAPVNAYIGMEFLQLQDEVEEINMNFEDQSFSSQISQAFEFIRPESRRVLGLEYETHLPKPKAKGSLKERKEKCQKKANLSVALFDKQQNGGDSICSQKFVKGENKQNMGPLRRDRSKKMVVNLSKQTSVICLGKTGQNHTPIMRQKSQKNIFGGLSHNSSECSSRNGSECGLRIQSQCSSKMIDNHGMKKKTSSRGRQLCRGESRDFKSKGKSKEKTLKETSLAKNGMMKRREDKKILPTCSFKIKLT